MNIDLPEGIDVFKIKCQSEHGQEWLSLQECIEWAKEDAFRKGVTHGFEIGMCNTTETAAELRPKLKQWRHNIDRNNMYEWPPGSLAKGGSVNIKEPETK